MALIGLNIITVVMVPARKEKEFKEWGINIGGREGVSDVINLQTK